MRKFLFALLIFPFLLGAQQKVVLSGYVKDATSGEDLIGAAVAIPALGTGTTTNTYGFYSIALPPGNYRIEYQYIGYQNKVDSVVLKADMSRNTQLVPLATQLDEAEVTAERIDANVKSVEMSVAKLDVKEIEKVPQLLGETDIIRTLTLLPGVSTVGEGSNGFNVRGGGADQNLILLDEAPVYNSSHLFGFFSIFNADAVKDVKLYKGGIPAQYGGRLSSVVDVRQKEGNSKGFGAKGGIGLLSSRLLLEGPIVKDKVSYMVAARRSYADIFLALSNDPDINQSTLYFYDLNTKINWTISDKDRLFLSGYFGRDVFGLDNLFGFDWGNGTGSLRWNHLFSKKLFANFTAVYSDYTYTLGSDGESNSFQLLSRIQDVHLDGEFNYYINPDNRIDFGFDMIYYRFSPGRVEASFLEEPIEFNKEFALEPNLYISHELKLGQRTTVQYGIRYSSFYKLGPKTVYEYQNPELPMVDELVDSTLYGSGELVAGFDGLQGLEPRLAVNYLLSDNISLKASYNRTRQYIQLISNTTSPTPVDLYRPAGQYIDPATVHQFALGYFHNFNENMYEASAEVYYKDFKDLVDYRDGADLVFNERIETEILRGGIGRAYGLELLLRKRKGRLTGWVGYTLSRTERKVDGTTPSQDINLGNWYLANFDKPHDFSLVANYSITKKWDVGGVVVYQTGRPYTLPEGKYEYEEFSIPIYTKRNNGRIPDYFRVDLSATYSPLKEPNQRFYSSWSFGIYNLLGRRNAYSIYFQSVANDPDSVGAERSFYNQTQAVRLSIFGTMVPSVTWNFNF
jgi:hypothetical protein